MRPAFWLQLATIVVSGVAFAERSWSILVCAFILLWAVVIAQDVERRHVRRGRAEQS